MALKIEDRLKALESMWVIRLFEDRCEQLYRDSKIRGSLHLCAGQEAVSVGTVLALDERDVVSATYRSHGWALARGVSPDAAFAEIMGKETGSSRGRGGSKHLGDLSVGMIPTNAIVSAGLPLAAGVGLANSLKGNKDVAVAVFGDGATNQGIFHETLTLASLWKLPVIFVCENNMYAEFTLGSSTNPVATLEERGQSYGIATASCDGMDLDAVYSAMSVAAARARNGEGPTYVEMRTYRYSGHMTGDPQQYRSPDEVEEWRSRDPLTLLEAALRAESVTDEQIAEVRATAEEIVARAEKFALESPEPELADALVGAPDWTQGVRR